MIRPCTRRGSCVSGSRYASNERASPATPAWCACSHSTRNSGFPSVSAYARSSSAAGRRSAVSASSRRWLASRPSGRSSVRSSAPRASSAASSGGTGAGHSASGLTAASTTSRAGSW